MFDDFIIILLIVITALCGIITFYLFLVFIHLKVQIGKVLAGILLTSSIHHFYTVFNTLNNLYTPCDVFMFQVELVIILLLTFAEFLLFFNIASIGYD